MTDRRSFLTAAAGGLSCASAAQATPPPQAALPDLSVLSRAALLHRPRASEAMRQQGLDALLVTRSANVYYATNYWPASDRMGAIGSVAALIPRDEKAPVAIVIAAFSHYYIASDMGYAPGVAAYLVGEPERAMFRLPAERRAEPREAARRQATAAARQGFQDRTAALAAAFADAGLRGGRIGCDDAVAESLLGAAFSTVPCEDTIRRIRMVKTPAEIELMTLASRANVAAALVAAQAARETPTLRGVRRRYFNEAVARGNAPVFMVVDGAMAEGFDAPIAEGAALMIDCVSACAGYHGDFARTVFVGEPRRALKRVTTAMDGAWGAVRERLKPGMPFSEIRAVGQRTMKALGAPYAVPFSPHLVGLHHSDQPAVGPDGQPVDLVLEEGMILSVDCPLLEAGLNATAHLEDLMLITADGAKPIHETPPATLTV